MNTIECLRNFGTTNNLCHATKVKLEIKTHKLCLLKQIRRARNKHIRWLYNCEGHDPHNIWHADEKVESNVITFGRLLMEILRLGSRYRTKYSWRIQTIFGHIAPMRKGRRNRCYWWWPSCWRRARTLWCKTEIACFDSNLEFQFFRLEKLVGGLLMNPFSQESWLIVRGCRFAVSQLRMKIFLAWHWWWLSMKNALVKLNARTKQLLEWPVTLVGISPGIFGRFFKLNYEKLSY